MTQVIEIPDTITINPPRGVDPVELNTETITADTIVALVAFAIQSRISNAYASMPRDGFKTDEAAMEAWTTEAHRHVAEAETNTIRFGSVGNVSVTIEIEALRDVIVDHARAKMGYKAVDARKASMTPKAYFIEVAQKMTTDTGRNVTPDAVESAFTAKAAPIVAAKKAAMATEIEI